MLRRAILSACLLLPASVHADGVLWGQQDGVLVFYPLAVCDTPPPGTRAICFDVPTGTLVAIDDAGVTTSIEGGGGGGAPTNATYWVGAAHGSLTNEINLGALATALVLNTAGTPSAYAGTSCGTANDWVQSLNGSGASTCAQPSFVNISGAATDAQVPNTITIDLAAAATALAANPTDCAANTFAQSIVASGNLTCAAIADADVPNNITISLAATATALAADGANCAAGSYPLGVDASGAVQGCTVAGGGSTHDLLSATHTDTTAASGVQGDVIVFSSGKWIRLGIGTGGQVLAVNDSGGLGTEIPAWTALASQAPANAEYIVSESNATLSAEVAPSAGNQVPVSSSSTAAAWGTVPIAAGGTGQTTAAAALVALGGPVLTASGAAPAAGAASAFAAPSETWLINTADNAVTTVETVMSVTSVPIGTYHFQYFLVWRAGATGTGAAFTVDYTGTVTRIRAARRGQTFNALAADGIADGTSAALTGGVVQGWGVVADNTALGPNTGVGATTEDQFDIIEGIIVVSTSANLNLAMTGEGNAAVTFKADSTLFLKRLQ